jgi:hypothetical protein
VSQLDTDLRTARDSTTAATSTQSVVEESLTKAEAARHKAAEEALRTTRERDEARTLAEQVRREAERLKRRIEELENAAPQPEEDAGARAENDALQRKVAAAETRARELERSLGELRTELEAARMQLAAEPAPGAQTGAQGGGGDDGASAEAVEAIRAVEALRNKAVEVYESINDVLSDIRNNLRLVHSDFTGLAGERNDDSVRTIFETLQALIDSAEDAKGVVRGLREIAEFS